MKTIGLVLFILVLAAMGLESGRRLRKAPSHWTTIVFVGTSLAITASFSVVLVWAHYRFLDLFFGSNGVQFFSLDDSDVRGAARQSLAFGVAGAIGYLACMGIGYREPPRRNS